MIKSTESNLVDDSLLGSLYRGEYVRKLLTGKTNFIAVHEHCDAPFLQHRRPSCLKLLLPISRKEINKLLNQLFGEETTFYSGRLFRPRENCRAIASVRLVCDETANQLPLNVSY